MSALREKFEAEWAAPRLASIHRHKVAGHDLNGSYISCVTQAAWEGYQAATEAAKATSVAMGELPKWIDDQKGKDPLMDDMIHYIETLHAEAARQPAPASQIEHERNMLAKGIADAALKAGIWNGEVNLTGPHLLMFCDDLAGAALAATAAPVLGLKMVCDPNMPSDQVEFRMNGETVGRIVNIAATRRQP